MRPATRARLLAAGFCALVNAISAQPAASPALCAPAQAVVFHCSFGKRSVSLCADTADGRIVALQWLQGRRGRIEVAWQARSGDAARFGAASSAIAPRAVVRQVWFDRAGQRHLLMQCVGGACPYAAGVAVLRGEAVLRQQRCERTADDRAWFAPALGRFGEDAAHSRAATELLEFADVDNGVERFFEVR